MKLYRTRNIIGIAAAYGLTALSAVGSFMLGQPWMIATAAVVSGGFNLWLDRTTKDFFDGGLRRHKESLTDSPRLGETVRDLYKKSGLKAEKHPVYDFEPVPEALDTKKGVSNAVLRAVFGMMSLDHQAAAANARQPVIMISKPLLKLLDDEEEKAVLAHEFAHAAARHTKLNTPRRILGGVASMTNSLVMLGAFFTSGWQAIVGAILGQGVFKYAFNKAAGPDSLLNAPDDTLEKEEKARKQEITKTRDLFGSLVTVGIVSYFNPVYLTLFAATQGLSFVNRVVKGGLSRHMEFQADRGAAVLGANPLSLVTALRKIVAVKERDMKERGVDLKPRGFLSRIWKRIDATHPLLENRISKLVGIARKQGYSEEQIAAAQTGPIVLPPYQKPDLDAFRFT